MGGTPLREGEIEARCLGVLRHWQGESLSIWTVHSYVTPRTPVGAIREILDGLVREGLAERREAIGDRPRYALASRVEPQKRVRRRA